MYLCSMKDWAAPGDIDNVKMKWHVPTLQELQLADTLLHAFLKPEIGRLKLFVAGQQDMDRFGVVALLCTVLWWFI